MSTAPPGTTPTSTAYREASNREKRNQIAHRLQAAERVTGIHLSPAARRIAVVRLAEREAHEMSDEWYCDWLRLVEELPHGLTRPRKTPKRAWVTAS